MIPKKAILCYFLARELDRTLAGTILHKIEYLKQSKTFRFLFSGDHKSHLEFSFAPPHFLLRSDWPDKADSFPVWQESAPAVTESVRGDRGNRILTLRLRRDSENVSSARLSIVFELFGAQSTAFLLDEQNLILQAIRVVDDHRQLRPREHYVAPEPLGDPLMTGEITIYEDRHRRFVLRFDGEQHVVLDREGQPLPAPDPLIWLYQSLEHVDDAERQLQASRRSWKNRIAREIGRLQQMTVRLEKDIAKCASAQQYAAWGDLLMGNPAATPIDGNVRVSDYYTGAAVEVALLPGKTVIETATAYYKLAKKLQRSEPLLRERLGKNQERIAALGAILNSLDAIASIAELEAATKPVAVDSRLKTLTPGAESDSRYYRTFLSSDGEKILVGKNAEGNDALTFRVARTYDLWFHTQQSPGSHVVLVLPDKNRQPSKRSIAEAAAAAAFYSDMRRVTNVPIVYTQRRYVRKVRKGAPGQVLYQNVKSIFVDPALPPNSTADD